MRCPATLGLLLTLSVGPALAFEGKPKFGPDAVPMTAATEYLRTAPAPDFWKLIQFYVPQTTSSACSLASVAAAVNFVRGVPPGGEDPLVTQAGLLETVADPAWAAESAEGGAGVRFAELVEAVRRSLVAYGIQGFTVEAFEPTGTSPLTKARLREILQANEASDRDVVLGYFNQGVLTGDWNGPHISPIGAFDAAAGQVLILDVDREWYVPYWVSDAKLLEAMLKPAPPDQGALAGETGGLVWIKAPEG
jgi:hypothetical protein